MENLWNVYGKSMEIYGNLWKNIEHIWKIYGNLWKSMESLWNVYWTSMEIYGNLWFLKWFPKMGVPQNGGFISWKIHLYMNDNCRYPYFRKPPFNHSICMYMYIYIPCKIIYLGSKYIYICTYIPWLLIYLGSTYI